jgi:hypothetical protein
MREGLKVTKQVLEAMREKTRKTVEVVCLMTTPTPIDTLQEDMGFIKTLSVWVPLAACPPVRRKHTGSKLPVAPQNPHLGVFSL